MNDEQEIRLEERRRCTRLCRKVVQEDRRNLRQAVADLKTDDPIHNRALDQVIWLIDNALGEAK